MKGGIGFPLFTANTHIFQFPLYLEPGVDRYLIYWQQLGSQIFQICRDLEDEGYIYKMGPPNYYEIYPYSHTHENNHGFS